MPTTDAIKGIAEMVAAQGIKSTAQGTGIIIALKDTVTERRAYAMAHCAVGALHFTIDTMERTMPAAARWEVEMTMTEAPFGMTGYDVRIAITNFAPGDEAAVGTVLARLTVAIKG